MEIWSTDCQAYHFDMVSPSTKLHVSAPGGWARGSRAWWLCVGPFLTPAISTWMLLSGYSPLLFFIIAILIHTRLPMVWASLCFSSGLWSLQLLVGQTLCCLLSVSSLNLGVPGGRHVSLKQNTLSDQHGWSHSRWQMNFGCINGLIAL